MRIVTNPKAPAKRTSRASYPSKVSPMKMNKPCKHSATNFSKCSALLWSQACKTHNGHRHVFISNPVDSENGWVPADQPSITLADVEGFTFNLGNIVLFHQGFCS